MSKVWNKFASKEYLIFTHNKMLKTRISQVAQQQVSSYAPAETFLRHPVKYSKGHMNVVILKRKKE